MKKFGLFFIYLITLLACKKEENYHLGEASALKNGMTWEAKPFAAFAGAYLPGHIGISTEVVNASGFLREEIGFHNVPLEIGQYPLGRANNPHTYSYVGTDLYTLLDDGDVLGDIYVLDTLATENYFEVVSYKESKKEIEVKFAATYLLERRANSNAPDTLRFEDGYIKTRVNN